MKETGMLNRLVSLALAAALALTLFAAPALAEDYIRTIKDQVNVRETPAGRIINADHQIPVGTVLQCFGTVINNNREWALVKYNGASGYVDSDCYAPCDVNGNLLSNTTGAGVIERTGEFGYVTTDNVFFRKTADPSGDFWARLPQGWELEVLGTKQAHGITWYKVRGSTPTAPSRTYTGYVHSNFFTVTGQATIVRTSSTVVPSGSGNSLGRVRTVKNNVNIRKTPNGTALTGKDENKVPINTYLDYDAGPVSAGGYNWVRVTYKGITGYIRSDCWIIISTASQTVISQPTAVPAAADAQGTVTLTKGGVNFRQQPNGTILGRLNKNTKLTYYGTQRYGSQDWYYVYSDAIGNYGYVLSTLGKVSAKATTKPAATATPDPKATATPKPGASSKSGDLITTIDKLFIRKSPSTQADSLTRLERSGVSLRFTDVTTAGGVTWYKVSYNGKAGWIHGNYVRVTSGGTASAATATPKPSNPTGTPNPASGDLSNLALTTADKVRIRKTASLSGKELTMVSKAGTKLDYLGKYAKDTSSAAGRTIIWYNVKYGSVSGWMHGDFVRVLTTAEKKAYNLTGDPSSPAEAEYRTLSKGSEGEDVTKLQQKLVELGYLASNQVSGKYLSSTEQAVIAFQKANKLTQDGIAGEKTQHALFNTVPVGTYDDSTVNPTLYPVEKVDWFKGDIQQVWGIGVTAVITDVYTGISFRAQRLYGGNHADAEPLTSADTTAICQIYGVSNAQEISDRDQELQSWRRRPLWVTVGGRTFAASMYGIPHNYEGDRIPDNNYNGQFCVHFVNSKTHGSSSNPAHVDTDASYNGNFGHQSAIQYAYTHSTSGTK